MPNNKTTQEKISLPKPPTNAWTEMPLVFRSFFAILFFILGFNFSETSFFNAYPVLGVHTIAVVFLSAVAAIFGFYIIPFLLVMSRYWVQSLIAKTVDEIVTNFWEMQSKKIQEARREKQKKKAEMDAAKTQRELDQGILVDTSMLIDGRILDIAKAGFLSGVLFIPEEVLNELHLVSDNADQLKRQRGRRGLDIVKELKKYAKVVSPKIGYKEALVDKVLAKYAKDTKMRLMTLDFNLNKVAAASGVKVLNINELSNALRTNYLPGELITIKIIQEGKEKAQGVGYLTDGTMVVVQNAKDKVGQEVNAKVAKVIQSPAGKMIFCELLNNSE